MAQPLPEQVDQGSFTRITSRLRSSLPPEVLVLHRNRPLLSIPAPSPSPMDTSASLDYASPLPSDTTPDSAKLFPPTSLLHLPGRPLKLADFPPSQTRCGSTLLAPGGWNSVSATFYSQPLILSTDPTRCAPIGIWPSASARKWTSPEMVHQTLPWGTRIVVPWPSAFAQHLGALF